MSYQNVGTPRFYLNIPEYAASVGLISNLPSVYRTLPVVPTTVGTWETSFIGEIPMGSYHGLSAYIALLGHNETDGIVIDSAGFPANPSIINGDFTNGVIEGFSIANTGNRPDADGITVTGDVGSILVGTYYDMNAPNLSLTMSREYGGTKEFTTHNGSSMSNTMWSKPPKWGDLGAWELGSGNPALSRSGRRTWDLKFSFMDDGDLWGSNQSLSTAVGNTLSESAIALYDGGIGGDLSDNTTFQYNLLTDDNFFSQVWHKTLGGTLPFIFQPDSSNNNPDQLCIAKFKDNSLKATQSSFNTYDISLSIEEVW